MSQARQQPIYLLADSQLLFWTDSGRSFVETIVQPAKTAPLKAAYIGASNGDKPEFYSIFEAAMENAGIRDCRMIRSSFPDQDRSFLQEADIVLLAGGDVLAGWNIFKEAGLKDAILDRYNDGALLIGTSAGAVQLGLFGWPEGEFEAVDIFETFKLVPLVIGVHDEKQEWETLKRVVRLMNGYVKGIGIPSGGGMVYYPDQSLAPIRHPLHEFSLADNVLTNNLLLPGSEKEEKYLVN
jgi:hypothetical protein